MTTTERTIITKRIRETVESCNRNRHFGNRNEKARAESTLDTTVQNWRSIAMELEKADPSFDRDAFLKECGIDEAQWLDKYSSSARSKGNIYA